jgi:hypothetical protein
MHARSAPTARTGTLTAANRAPIRRNAEPPGVRPTVSRARASPARQNRLIGVRCGQPCRPTGSGARYRRLGVPRSWWGSATSRD